MDTTLSHYRIQCCKCFGGQNIVPPRSPGGVTLDEAQFLGWTWTKEGWSCPLCAENPNNLFRIFDP